jgi:hypothetical protein
MSDLDARTREWYFEAEITMLNMRIYELEAQNEKLDNTRVEYIGMINKLVDERAKLRKALLAVYDNSLGLDPDKITDDIEWVTAEIRAVREALETEK